VSSTVTSPHEGRGRSRCAAAGRVTHRTQQSAQSAFLYSYAATPLPITACTFFTFLCYEGTGDGGHPASDANRRCSCVSLRRGCRGVGTPL